MTAFRVTIDGRAYEGHYDSPANAVFGCMRKDEIENCPRPPREWKTPEGKAQYERKRTRARDRLSPPLVIHVEEVTGRKVARKVHIA